MANAMRPAAVSASRATTSTAPPTSAATFGQRLSASKAILAHAGELDDSGLREILETTVFGDLDHFLEFLHYRWTTLFGVALEERLDLDSASLAACVEEAWRDVARRESLLYRFLSRYSLHPTVRLEALRQSEILAASGVALPNF